MKILGIIICTIMFSLTFGQITDINSAKTNFDQKNYANAVKHLISAKNELKTNRNLVDDKNMALYLYLKGEVYYAIANSSDPQIQNIDSNALRKAVVAIADLNKFEKSKSYMLKNKDTNEKEYFDSEQEAKAKASTGNYGKLRVRNRRPEYSDELNSVLNSRANEFLNKGATNYNNKNYIEAGKNFVGAYYLQEAIGIKDESLLYNSAISSLLGNDYGNAIITLKDLIKRGYTGVKTLFKATDVKTGKQVAFQNKRDRDLQIKLGLFNSPVDEEQKSVELDIHRYLASAYDKVGKPDEAIEVLKKAFAKFPNESVILSSLGEVYHKTGNTKEFMKTLEDGLRLNPNDHLLLYNMGVILTQGGKYDEAKAYYRKAISKKPDYVQSYINLASLILKKEGDIVKELNELGFSKKDLEREKVLKKQRIEIYKEAIPILENALKYSPNDRIVLSSLRDIYSNMDDPRYEKVNEKIKQIDAEQNNQ